MELKKYLCFAIVSVSFFIMGILVTLAGILSGVILIIWNMTDRLVYCLNAEANESACLVRKKGKTEYWKES